MWSYKLTTYYQLTYSASQQRVVSGPNDDLLQHYIPSAMKFLLPARPNCVLPPVLHLLFILFVLLLAVPCNVLQQGFCTVSVTAAVAAFIAVKLTCRLFVSCH